MSSQLTGSYPSPVVSLDGGPFDPDVVLGRRLRWLIAIRVLVVITIASTYAATALGSELPGWTAPVRAIVAGVSVLTLLHIALLETLPVRMARSLAYLQLVGDVVLIAVFIETLGKAGAGFSILYLVIISVGSALMRPVSGLVIAGLAFLCHAGPLLAHRYGRFERQGLGSGMSTGELAYNLVIHLIGFSAVALMAAYLARDTARAESALREKAADLERLEALYRDVVRSLPSGLITTDTMGLITSVNRAAGRILDRRRSTLVGAPIQRSGLFSAAAWREAAAAARPSGPPTPHGGRKIRQELRVAVGGGTIPVGYSVTPLNDDAGRERGFIVHFRDLTELRRLEERLRTQDRMATLGTLAAGLAHEVGNPLAAISGSAQMLAQSLEDDPARQRLLDIAVRESERLDRTVKTFLALARPPEQRLVRFDVAKLLREQTSLLRNSPEVTLAHDVVVEAAAGAIELEADPDQVSQVFWNIARNALKAMPGGGTLTVAVRDAGPDVVLTFTDTGSGMTDSERAELFQPFSSFFDDGVGLGMAIVYRIVEDHGGDIQVESQPGIGSRIIIALPRAAAAQGERRVEG